MPGMLAQAAAWLAVGGVCAAGMASGAQAEIRQCTEQRVEYLIGGAGKSAAAEKTCISPVVGSSPAPSAPAANAKGQAAPVQGAARFSKFDDEGRREILQQELRLARQGLADLDRSPAPGAGTLQEQRLRRQGDITALESELGRLKKTP